MNIPFRRRPLFYQHGHANFLDFFKQKPKPDPNSAANKKQPVKQQDGSFLLEGKKVKQDPNNPENWIEDTTTSTNKSTDPLDNFKDLFKISSADGDKNKPPSFQLDPEAVKKLVGQLSFSGHVTPELVEKLKTGDAEATKQAMDDLGRQVYSTIFSHLPQLTEHYVGSRIEHERKGLGATVKSHMTQQSLEKLAENNPQLKEHLGSISNMMLAKYPDATPDWLAEQTKNYFLTIASTLDPRLAKVLSGEIKVDGTQGNQGEHTPGAGLPDDFWAGWVTGEKPNTNQQ